MAPRRTRPATLTRVAFLLTMGLMPLLLSAGPAQAATSTAFARVAGDDDGYLADFIYDGGPDRNQVKVVVAETGDFLWFVYLIDDIVPIKAGTNCTHPDSKDRTLVECVVQRATPGGYYLSTQIRLGAGNDQLTFTDPLPESPKAIDLGPGNDTYVTTLPKAHDAYLIAGDGNDTLKVGKDAIVFAGAGEDKVTLIGGSAQVNGGDGNDVIKGGPGDDYLRGENGKDVIYGNKGDDTLVGNPGNDELHGGPGADVMQGNSGNDALYGDAGNDRISGGPGRDQLDGGAGQNTLVN